MVTSYCYTDIHKVLDFIIHQEHLLSVNKNPDDWHWSDYLLADIDLEENNH